MRLVLFVLGLLALTWWAGAFRSVPAVVEGKELNVVGRRVVFTATVIGSRGERMTFVTPDGWRVTGVLEQTMGREWLDRPVRVTGTVFGPWAVRVEDLK